MSHLPSMILLKTVKGKGVSFIENMGATNHNAMLSPAQVELALQEIG